MKKRNNFLREAGVLLIALFIVLSTMAVSGIGDFQSPPEKPSTPSGPIEGEVDVEYMFCSSTTDPEGNEVYYWFDWGDGTSAEWIGPYPSGEEVCVYHTYTSNGTYCIKVKAKDIGDEESDWSDPLCVNISGECEPSIDVEKYVKDPCGDWVDADTRDEALDLPICTDVQFKIVVHNNGECCGSLFDIWVSDLMHDSLEYISADPEPMYFYYYPPYYFMEWYFPGPLEQCNKIEIYINAHVEGPDCSVDENYAAAMALSDCEPYEVYDQDSAWVHAFENDPPSRPTIAGPTKVGANVQNFWTFHSTDPDGDPVRYVIDWGDGGNITTTICYPSCTPVNVSHTYVKTGTYIITAVAIDCCWGAKGQNSTYQVEVPRNRAATYLWYHWFLYRFPLLEKLLRNILRF